MSWYGSCMSNPFEHPEFSERLTLANRFERIIDEKMIDARRITAATRKHEDTVRLLPARPLALCPKAHVVFMSRPTPGQEKEARATWHQWGGYNVQILERWPISCYDENALDSGAPWNSPYAVVESTFFADGDKLFHRHIHSFAGESGMAIDEVDPENITDFFDWLEAGVPEPDLADPMRPGAF